MKNLGIKHLIAACLAGVVIILFCVLTSQIVSSNVSVVENNNLQKNKVALKSIKDQPKLAGDEVNNSGTGQELSSSSSLKLPLHCRIKNPLLGECDCDICENTQKRKLILDQKQTIYNGGTSARVSPGRSFWQSFTPSVSGSLERIDIGFFNEINGSGILIIYAGEGITGKQLYSKVISVKSADRFGSWNSYFMHIPVESEKKYTFQFAPDLNSMPDPYGVCIGSCSKEQKAVGIGAKLLYPRGTYGSAQNGNVYKSDHFQSVFRTFVKPFEM